MSSRSLLIFSLAAVAHVQAAPVSVPVRVVTPVIVPVRTYTPPPAPPRAPTPVPAPPVRVTPSSSNSSAAANQSALNTQIMLQQASYSCDTPQGRERRRDCRQ